MRKLILVFGILLLSTMNHSCTDEAKADNQNYEVQAGGKSEEPDRGDD